METRIPSENRGRGWSCAAANHRMPSTAGKYKKPREKQETNPSLDSSETAQHCLTP
jgi:hypothetical protein